MKFQAVISTGGISETIHFCSVTRYYLSIEQNFIGNQFVSSKNDTGFSLYSKREGENSGLKFIFHIKYDKGIRIQRRTRTHNSHN